MRRSAVLVGVVVLVLLVAGPALGKGPTGVTIEGPGESDSVVIDGNGEFSSGTEFSGFVGAAGFWELVFAADMKGTGLELRAEPPTQQLGVRYTLTWHLGEARIVSFAYPSARGGPFVYVEPGTDIVGFNTTTSGGWYTAPIELAEMLDGYRRAADGAQQQPTEGRSDKAVTPQPANPVLSPVNESYRELVDAAGVHEGSAAAIIAPPQAGDEAAGSPAAPQWGPGVLVVLLVFGGGVVSLLLLVRRRLAPR